MCFISNNVQNCIANFIQLFKINFMQNTPNIVEIQVSIIAENPRANLNTHKQKSQINILVL